MIATTPNTFASAVPIYAAAGVAIFPMIARDGKRPLVRHYVKMGIPASRRIAAGKLGSADAFGFCAGPRSRLTVLDVDSHDERQIADALDLYGDTPLIVRSGSGNWQAWYRHNGEPRSIRPDKTRPWDILGRGVVVAPSSQGRNGRYQFIAGSLDELAQLPFMRQIVPSVPAIEHADLSDLSGMREGSGRNDALFRMLGKKAHGCDHFDSLLDLARALNAAYAQPMDEAEVVKVARSVWRMTEMGRNRFGQHGAWSPSDEVNRLVGTDNDAFLVLSYLRANNGPRADFFVTNSLAKRLGMTRLRLASARDRLMEMKYLVRTRRAATGQPARYRWNNKKHNRGVC